MSMLEHKGKLITGFLATVIAIGTAIMYNKEDGASNTSPTSKTLDTNVAQDAEAKLAQRNTDIANAQKQACDYLSGRQRILGNLRFMQHGYIEEFKALIECGRQPMKDVADLKRFGEKYKLMCVNINEGLQKNKDRFRHPILNPFFQDLKDKLCTPEIEKILQADSNPEIGPGEFKYLSDLKNNLEKLRPTIEGKSPKEICAPGLEFAKRRLGDIQVVAKYFVGLRNRPDFNQAKYPNLSKAMQRVLDGVKKAKTKEGEGANAPVTDLDIEKYFTKNLNSLEKQAGRAWVICSLPIDFIINNLIPGMSVEVLKERRAEMLPAIKELLEILEADNSEQAKVVKRAMMKIAVDMEKL